VLEQKFMSNLKITFDAAKCDEIYTLCSNQEALENTSVTDFQELFTLQNNNF
jgi:2-methylcitrate dehydratase